MRIVLYGVIGYLLLVGFVWLIQRKMLYFPDPTASIQAVPWAEGEFLEPWPEAGEEFYGYIGRPPSGLALRRGTIVVFHGNAGSARDRGYYPRALAPRGYHVVLAEYPGYGSRAGEPSEEALIREGRETARRALAAWGGPLWLWGESLGAAVAAGVAADHTLPVAGIVLITPWDSLANLAQSLYWYLPARWLLRDRYDTITALRRYAGPIAVLIAEHDDIIPTRHSQRLYEALKVPKRRWLFAGAGHNNWPVHPQAAWWDEVLEWLHREVSDIRSQVPGISNDHTIARLSRLDVRMNLPAPHLHHQTAAEYYFAEGCFITEWWNSPMDEAVSVARARVEPGVTTRWHRLQGVTERYLILEGQGWVEVDILPPEAVESGAVVVIPPGTRQRITNTGDVDLIFLAVCTPRFTPTSYEDVELSSEVV